MIEREKVWETKQQKRRKENIKFIETMKIEIPE